MPKSFRLWHAHLYMYIWGHLCFFDRDKGAPIFFYKHQKNTYDGKKPDFSRQLISAPSKAQRWMMSTLNYWHPYKP